MSSALKKVLMASVILCPIVEQYNLEPSEELQKFINGGLTDKEIEDGYFIDVVLGKCNIKKAMAERAEAIRREYEVFDNMHCADGTFTTKRFSRL